MAGVAAIVLTGAAIAQNTSTSNTDNSPLASLQNDAFVTLTGTVSNITDDEFELNYGDDNTITVELDNFDFQVMKPNI